MMQNATDTKLEDILISPCVPYSYSLGPHPIRSGYLLTRGAAEFAPDIRDDVFIEKRSNEKWAVCYGNLCLSKKTGEFQFEPSPSNRTEDFKNEFRFDSMVEAKEFWYETYIKNLLKTCCDEDSGILGVLCVETDSETGKKQLSWNKW